MQAPESEPSLNLVLPVTLPCKGLKSLKLELRGLDSQSPKRETPLCSQVEAAADCTCLLSQELSTLSPGGGGDVPLRCAGCFSLGFSMGILCQTIPASSRYAGSPKPRPENTPSLRIEGFRGEVYSGFSAAEPQSLCSLWPRQRFLSAGFRMEA